MPASQKQIAEKLGVSIALVSRVLSNQAKEIGIAPDTIERVLKTARETGYVPSAAALTLKGKSTRTIGVAVYDFNDPFFGPLIEQIQTEAHEHNYSLVLAGFLNRVPGEQDLQPLHKHAIDGLIILGSDTRVEWLNDFDHLPVARIGHGAPGEKSVRVTIDEADAARQILARLAGRTSPLYLCRPLRAHLLRRTAMEKAATEAGLSLSSAFFEDYDTISGGRQTLLRLLETTPQTDALICATDPIAMGALHALHDLHVSVPGQIAVTGFDDIASSEHFLPPITTLRQPIKEFVKRAFAAVIDSADPQEILLPGTLLVRETA